MSASVPAVERSSLPLVCVVASCGAGCCGDRPAIGSELKVGLGSLEKPVPVSL